MSEEQISSGSPDELILGESLRSENGILCSPAIDPLTGEQLIVKIITIPADPDQAKALLYSGACSSEEQVQEYYTEKAHNILDQADLLLKLSDSGFIPYRNVRLEDNENGPGHKITLISEYQTEHLPAPDDPCWTRRKALELGLRLCECLMNCRKQGYLYTNFRLENLFLDSNGDCCIGDLGFVPLDALSYSIIDRKHRSSYTPPEMETAYSTLDTTMDTYAVGMLLYQIYNGGILPDKHDLKPPANADYLLWPILEAACHPDAAQRFDSPLALHRAIQDYMRACTDLDQPVVYHSVAAVPAADETVRFLTEEENDTMHSGLMLMLPDEEPPVAEMDKAFEGPSGSEDVDVAEMLAQADDLIRHELPQPVVAPTPGDFSIPEPVLTGESAVQEEPEPEPDVVILPAPEEPVQDMPDEEETAEDDEPKPVIAASRKSRKPIIAAVVITVVLALILGGVFGTIYYQNTYLQNIEKLTVTAADDRAQILIQSDIEDHLLLVVCTDTYGNTIRCGVSGGVANLSGLNPNTHYRIEVQITGTHKLTGETRTSFTTTAHTQVQNFSAVCGQLSGSAVLSFSVSGQAGTWTLKYSTPGEQEREISFTGTTVTVNGLRIGKEYTFQLITGDDIILVGQTQLKYTAQAVVLAQNIRPVSCTASSLTVRWDAPDSPIRWQVRCYNGTDYDKTITVTDTIATFDGIDFRNGYTVLVTAEGMSRSESISIPADPLRVHDVVFTPEGSKLLVSWTYDGTVPAGGWLLNYSIDNGASVQLVCSDASAKLPLTAGGSYMITLSAPDGQIVISQPYSYSAAE